MRPGLAVRLGAEGRAFESHLCASGRFAGSVTVLITTRKMQLVESYGSTLLPMPPKPLDPDPSMRLVVLTSGRSRRELIATSQDAKALTQLVSLSAGLPAMLRSVGRMCTSRSPVAALQFFETHSASQRLPTTMARSDGYQVEQVKEAWDSDPLGCRLVLVRCCCCCVC